MFGNLLRECGVLNALSETAQNELAEQDKFTLKLVNNEVASCAEELYHVICRRAGIAQ